MHLQYLYCPCQHHLRPKGVVGHHPIDLIPCGKFTLLHRSQALHDQLSRGLTASCLNVVVVVVVVVLVVVVVAVAVAVAVAVVVVVVTVSH